MGGAAISYVLKWEAIVAASVFGKPRLGSAPGPGRGGGPEKIDTRVVQQPQQVATAARVEALTKGFLAQTIPTRHVVIEKRLWRKLRRNTCSTRCA